MEGPSFVSGLESRPPLLVATAGSVDDGKSTLIGRLLYDSGLIADDQAETLRKMAAQSGSDRPDFAAITDGLTDERDQGITIDVAYRYVDTPARRVVIADVPGHEQYTRNMITGASSADVVIILTDVLRGATTQTWRHLCIALLLGVPHVVVAVNKMDLVDYSVDRFSAIVEQVRRRAAPFSATRIHFLPLSAYQGDNVVHRTDRMPWFDGPPLIELLQSFTANDTAQPGPFRFPVQYILRPDGKSLDPRRAYMGRISSGAVATGDQVVILPGNRPARIAAIERLGVAVDGATASQSVSLYLDRDIDVARGDIIAVAAEQPEPRSSFDAVLFWLGGRPLDPARRYQLRHGSRSVLAKVSSVEAVIDVAGPARTAPPDSLAENSLAIVRLLLQTPLAVDDYRRNRKNGTFILINEQTNETVAAGLVGADMVPAGL